MPEGHKTHRFAIDHSALFCGCKVHVSSPQGRFSSDAMKVDRQVLANVVAAGKHLFYQFENDLFVHVHLGRYGSFRLGPVPSPPARGLVRMRIVNDKATLDLNGPTQCRVIDTVDRDQVLARLGPDPLAGGLAADVWQNVASSKQPIGALLLDQVVIAGIGNIFRAEALFEIGMNPETRGCDLDRKSFDRLWRVLVRMLRTGVKHDQIIAVTAKEAGKPLEKLDKHQRLRIYGKTTCMRCAGPVAVVKMAARKLYVCHHCQA
ncbi:MAG TPA: formamidopyrimidine-DNA glycosylase [Planctomycetaceae bacterium]|nr:formamidopyrimidine-DNA glycosylase [Planctomycetaceae bacterium]